jgi:hypothetical protein
MPAQAVPGPIVVVTRPDDIPLRLQDESGTEKLEPATEFEMA